MGTMKKIIYESCKPSEAVCHKGRTFHVILYEDRSATVNEVIDKKGKLVSV